MEKARFRSADIYGQRIHMSPRQAIAGHAIGIVVLDLWYPYFPGNVANATTYDFPVRYKVLRGATGEMIFRADPALLDMVLEAGREFEEDGVRALVGACGYFGNYQQQAAAALDIPVFLSSLLQVPMVHRGLKPTQKVGILVASAKNATPRMLENCGVTPDVPIAIKGMDGQPEFQNILDCTGHQEYGKLEQELVAKAQELVAENPEVGAIVLECSDMPPFAWAIQRAVQLPVFDFNTLINWVYRGLLPQRYDGYF